MYISNNDDSNNMKAAVNAVECRLNDQQVAAEVQARRADTSSVWFPWAPLLWTLPPDAAGGLRSRPET